MIQRQENLKTPVQYLKGVGPTLSLRLDKMQIKTVADLLWHIPHRYTDRRNIQPIQKIIPGVFQTIIGSVVGGAPKRLGARKKIYEILIKDETGLALLIFFHFKEDYLQKKYPVGKKLLVHGLCQTFRSQFQFVHPDIEELDEEGKHLSHPILPVYPLTEGLHQKTMRKIIGNALEKFLPFLEETPLAVHKTMQVKLSLKEALYALHHPPENASIEELNEHETIWHQRMAYDELFYLQLGLQMRKSILKENANPLMQSSPIYEKALHLLPFKLTRSQEVALGEIIQDLQKNIPMNRLLEGDVGSGKTIVSFLASFWAMGNGVQVALMAPTDTLAAQHLSNFQKYFGDKICVSFLSSGTSKKEREILLSELKTGKIQLLIGTHALIQEGVDFQNLGLIIIDEQHRFGVRARGELKNKGPSPHVLVMSATPIPRTLAMSIYADLNLSILDEKPPGRQPIHTQIISPKDKKSILPLIQKELAQGRQMYVVCPLIEESEKIDLKDATKTAEKLTRFFSHYIVGLMHGRLDAAQKEIIMNQFKKNEIQILVSTTVIEVGVDVPNVSLMIIEHAERFGLSQLHQLRGRIGRGRFASYCFLMRDHRGLETTERRLKIMEQTENGFKIAEEDLLLRGPGDFLGTRQSGLPVFKIANLLRHQNLITLAQKRVAEIVTEDNELKKIEHQILKNILWERWKEKLDLGQIS